MPVVDASIVVDWVAPGVDQDGPAARLLGHLSGEGDPVLGPRLLAEEVADALVTGVRRRRWTGAQADTAFTLLRQLPMQFVDQPRDLDRAWDLSRRYDEHPIYDLVYVAVAERLGIDLVTADQALHGRVSTLGFVVLLT